MEGVFVLVVVVVVMCARTVMDERCPEKKTLLESDGCRLLWLERVKPPKCPGGRGRGHGPPGDKSMQVALQSRLG